LPMTNNPLKIAVDLDGVLAESMIVWCELANAEFGTHLRLEDLDSWASWRKFAISKDDFYRILDESWDDWERIPPTEPGIARKVAGIEKFGLVDVVTGRSEKTEEAARKWINSQRVRFNQFVRVPGWREKADLDYDVFIDDAPDLMPLLSRRLIPWAILYERPWNRTVPHLRKMLRAKSWRQIPKLLESIRKTEC
jgi:5'(3')-deoxyribonucleotidase